MPDNLKTDICGALDITRTPSNKQYIFRFQAKRRQNSLIRLLNRLVVATLLSSDDSIECECLLTAVVAGGLLDSLGSKVSETL